MVTAGFYVVVLRETKGTRGLHSEALARAFREDVRFRVEGLIRDNDMRIHGYDCYYKALTTQSANAKHLTRVGKKNKRTRFLLQVILQCGEKSISSAANHCLLASTRTGSVDTSTSTIARRMITVRTTIRIVMSNIVTR